MNRPQRSMPTPVRYLWTDVMMMDAWECERTSTWEEVPSAKMKRLPCSWSRSPGNLQKDMIHHLFGSVGPFEYLLIRFEIWKTSGAIQDFLPKRS
ncbi:hypothetical protein GDO81_027663 [Engystomops pustulosus]|uniref:Uncharacterized protein n=1 Tax=Engystomops pustulosus TaxID=76066 RepID=A0AAV6YP94_ENGPU|nr:hypothetical protein GDO81_027663 [Engystomops pustulosus]